jgi:hypothetical protein
VTYFVQASVGGEHRYLGTFATLQQARARLVEMRTRLPPIRRPPRFGHVEKRNNNRWAASVQIKGLRFFVGGYATKARAEKALKEVHDLGDADRMIASLQARRASRPMRRDRGSIRAVTGGRTIGVPDSALPACAYMLGITEQRKRLSRRSR